MDTTVAIIPTQGEFKTIVEKIHNSNNRKRTSYLINGNEEKNPNVLSSEFYILESKKHKMFCLDNKNSDILYDVYDDYGRNISKQERRQELVPWVKVTYRKGRLYIPIDKKNAMKSLRLL